MEMANEIYHDPTKPEATKLVNGDTKTVTNNSIDEGETVSLVTEFENGDAKNVTNNSIDEQKTVSEVAEFENGDAENVTSNCIDEPKTVSEMTEFENGDAVNVTSKTIDERKTVSGMTEFENGDAVNVTSNSIDEGKTVSEITEFENSDAENVTNNSTDEGKTVSEITEFENGDAESVTNNFIDERKSVYEATGFENGDAENVTNNPIDEGKTVSESGDDEDFECLEEEETNMNKQGQHSEAHEKDLNTADILEHKIEFPERPGKIVIGSNHKFPVRSRYLSGSVGSCHDLCKYGHKRPEHEKSTPRPSSGTVRERRTLERTGSDNLVRALLNEGKKTKDGRRLSLQPSSKGEKDCSPSLNQLKIKRVQSETKPPSVPSSRVWNRNESEMKKKDGRRFSLPPTSKGEKDFSPDLNQSKFKRFQSERKPSSVTSASLKSGNECRTGKKVVGQSSSLVENTTPKVNEVETKPKKAKENGKESGSDVKKSSSIEARLYKNLKDTSHVKKQIVSKVESVKKVLKVAPTDGASTSTRRRPRGGKNEDSKDGQREGQNGQSEDQNGQSEGQNGLKEKISQGKEEGQKKSERISAKMVRKTKLENGSKPDSSRTKSGGDSRMILKRRGSLPEEKDSSAWKLKFKRGTVVALQGSSSSPRKLKFKRGKILAGDENGKNGIACELNHNDNTGNEPNIAKPEPPKVQLRHQETSSKKDNVDLNNVIEETATKLVKTRKSKVKALVGAFESVMTIGESRMEAGAS